MTMPTQKKKYEQSSLPLSEPSSMAKVPKTLRDRELSTSLNEPVKLFLLNGSMMYGVLLAYDETTMLISNENPDMRPVIVNYENVCTTVPQS